MFDLILGIETDFQEHTIQIDHTVVAMRLYTSLTQKPNIRAKAF